MSTRRSFIKKIGVGALGVTAVNASAINKLTDVNGYSLFGENKVIKGSGEFIKVKVKTPLFCPYHGPRIKGIHPDKGGNAHYYYSNAFVHNPFSIRASGVSGSPVIVDKEGNFFGFMTTNGYENSTFSFDGVDTLSIQVPEGQEVFIDETGRGDEAWKDYNSVMMKRLNIEPLKNTPKFWSDVEYCTWSEQKYQGKKRFEHFHLLNDKFIENYLDKVIEMGYPKGKLTIDHGWGQFPDGSINSGFGSWYPDSKKFPNFKKTMDMICKKGFTPGLWIAFPKIHKNSIIAQKYPEMLGSYRKGTTPDRKNDIQWLNPKADIFEYASEVISRYYEMGVRKFKIDMSYNTKSDMLHIHKELYKAAKIIDPDIEMEFHVADIFFAKYIDVMRTNDVWLNEKYDWRSRVATHYEISLKSMPGRGINLDHIGGNDLNALNPENFLEHLNMYKTKKGYPLVSVLPHHYSEKCVKATGDYLWEYAKGPRDFISDFYNK